MRSPIDSETLLDVTLSAICARNQYTRDPAPVIAELIAAARGRDDVLAQAAGIWAGYFDSTETRALATALRAIPGAEPWVTEGRRRRGIPRHGAPIPQLDPTNPYPAVNEKEPRRIAATGLPSTRRDSNP